jgi:hypothetical protein
LQKVILITVFLILAAGCSPLRKQQKSPSYADSSELNISRVLNHNLSISCFNITKGKVRYNDDKTSEEAFFNLKYSPDFKFLVSLRSRAGIEGARIYFDKDTILANDRINHKFYVGSSRYFLIKYGIDKEILPLIFGDLKTLLPVDENINCKNNECLIVQERDQRKLIYFFDCKIEKLVKVQIYNELSEKGVEIQFSEFITIDGKIFPGQIKIIETQSGGIVEISLEKIDYNCSENFGITEGSGYERIEIK